MEILTLSTSRNILKPGSRDRARMELYARQLDAFHIVVACRESEGCEEIHSGSLHVYPTCSRSRPGKLIDAFRIARRVLASRRGVPITLSSQDPLEVGFATLILARMARVPFTVQVHGDYYSPHWLSGSLINYIRRLLIPVVLRGAARIRVVSERIKGSLVARGIPAEKINVLPIRPELDVFLRESPIQKSEDAPFIILTASRFSPEKDIPRLVAAFARMRATCPRAVLRIVGSGPEEARIRASARTHGVSEYVELLPWTEHIEAEMVQADVFALASQHEAYGLVLIEALAAGTPVVTTDVGCVGEVVRDDIHGIVVHKEGDQPYADALARMYRDSELRVRSGEAGRALGERLALVSAEEYAQKWVAVHAHV